MPPQHQIDVRAMRRMKRWRWTCICGATSERRYRTSEEALRASRWHYRQDAPKMVNVDIRPDTPDDEVCDFCSLHVSSLWTYPVDDFVVDLLMVQSVGYWAACAACRDFIERDDREGLARRSVEMLGVPAVAGTSKMMNEIVSNLHATFFSHRQGPAEKRLKPKGMA